MTPAAGLSCYTSALHAYLSLEWKATEIISRSVHLAVRRDRAHAQLSFSHHSPSLDVLPDGSHLEYLSGSTYDVLDALSNELLRYGRAIVVTDTARLPWSFGHGGPSAPHWILLDGCSDQRWSIRDKFCALVPNGQQQPWSGELSDAELIEAMTLPADWRPVQSTRNKLVFGAPVPVPAGPMMWLRRHGGIAAIHALRCEDGWQFGDTAIDALVEDFQADDTRFFRSMDDLWAAAGHHGFALRWQREVARTDRERQALSPRIDRWEALPKVLRIAQESVLRGRPRPSLVESALGALRSEPQ